MHLKGKGRNEENYTKDITRRATRGEQAEDGYKSNSRGYGAKIRKIQE